MFINGTETIGLIIAAGTTNLTGSIEATLFLILAVLFVFFMVFGVPLEFTAIFILPFCIAVGAYYSSFMIPITVLLIFISMIIAKNWLFR